MIRIRGPGSLRVHGLSAVADTGGQGAPAKAWIGRARHFAARRRLMQSAGLEPEAAKVRTRRAEVGDVYIPG